MSGVNNTSEIASAFKDYYSNIFVKSSHDIGSINEYFDLINGLGSTISDKLPCINVELVETCIKQLTIAKSAGADSIAAEHIRNCYTSIIIHTKLLLTMTISHSAASESFGVGIIIPIPKVKSGDHSSPDNSIPLTL